MDILIPGEMPVMTLPDCVFFPQALLPLHIFEPRYRRMLKDVLAGNRLFAIASLDQTQAGEPGPLEPPHRVATVGIVRVCQKNEAQTSNLLLQGLCRVKIDRIVREEPYRTIAVRPLLSEPGADAVKLQRIQTDLVRLIAVKQKLGGNLPTELTEFLRGIDDPETCVDLAAFSLCENVGLKQRLLETLDVFQRFEIFKARLKAEIESIKLRKKLQGSLPDDDIAAN
jgi:ATP-dependent Lon protease